jgi:hypothetical protein
MTTNEALTESMSGFGDRSLITSWGPRDISIAKYIHGVHCSDYIQVAVVSTSHYFFLLSVGVEKSDREYPFSRTLELHPMPREVKGYPPIDD